MLNQQAIVMPLLAVVAIGGAACASHIEGEQESIGYERAGAQSGLTQQQIDRAAVLHAEATVGLAHDHIIDSTEFEGALEGGLTALGLDILAGDGQEHVNSCREPRTPQEIYDLYDANLALLDGIVQSSSGRYRIATSVAEIRDAKVNDELAIVIGTEAADHIVSLGNAPTPQDVRVGVRDRYETGWRKSSLWYPAVFANDRCGGPGGLGSSNLYFYGGYAMTDHGCALVQEMNRTGVVIDVTHLPQQLLTQVLEGRPNKGHERNNAPIISSHDFAAGGPSVSYLRSIADSGGGYGVIGYNFIPNFFPGYPNVTAATVVSAMSTLKNIVGEDHIVLGGDYYGGQFGFVPATVAEMRDLTEEFVAQGYTDDQIKKVLGDNLLAAYERAWDPTRGYSGGPARFYTCTNTSVSAECLAVRSHGGQGDFNHRPVTCLNSVPGAVSLQLTYRNGAWRSWSPSSTLVPCTNGSLLAVTWGDGLPNGRIGLCANNSTDPMCVLAASAGGSGSSDARAINCLSPLGQGAIGLHIPYSGGKWKYYNLAALLNDCTAGSLLAVRWGANANGTAEVQLCDDRGSDAADPRANATCVAAAANGGGGTGVIRALSCYNSSAVESAHGAVGLQLKYVDGRWYYYNVQGTLHPCVHGSVLVARN